MTDTEKLKADNGDNMVGQLFEDRFEIISVLGRGGMGMVYKARQVHMDKIVAIKTVVQGTVFDDKSFLRFEQEARTAASLTHPNIISIFDFGRSKEQGFAYLVMEYISGKNLEDVIIESEALPPERFWRIFSQVCDGMQHAHNKGIIHRDLKPTNIMLCLQEENFDQVKIVDFGLAKLSRGQEQHLTQSGIVLGSPLFMSPEQGRGAELDHRSDIYSLACVMYSSLTGHVPLKGANSMATIYKHISDRPPFMSEVAPELNISPRLEEVVMRALEKDPALRPQSMDTFRDEIAEALHINRTKSVQSTNGSSSTYSTTPEHSKQAEKPEHSMPAKKPEHSMPAKKPEHSMPAKKPGHSMPAKKPGHSMPAKKSASLAALPLVSSVIAVCMLVVFAVSKYMSENTAQMPETRSSASSSNSKANENKQATSASTALASKNNLPAAEKEKPASKKQNPALTATAPGNTETGITPGNTETGITPGNTETGIASKTKASTKPVAQDQLKTTAETEAKNKAANISSLVDRKKLDLYKIKKELSSEKKIALDLAYKFSTDAKEQFVQGNYSQSQILFQKALDQERVIFGDTDPHLLPSATHIISCLRNGAGRQDEIAAYLDLALRCFDKNQSEATSFVNSTSMPLTVWKPLALQCLQTAQTNRSFELRKSYAQWSLEFFGLACKQWKEPKDDKYYDFLNSYVSACHLAGDSRQKKDVLDELRSAGKLKAPQLHDFPGYLPERNQLRPFPQRFRNFIRNKRPHEQ